MLYVSDRNHYTSIKDTAKNLGFKYVWHCIGNFLTHDNSYHVFGIAETRLGHEVKDNIVHIPGYSVLRQDRNINGGSQLA